MKMRGFIEAAALLVLLNLAFSASYPSFDYCDGTTWIKYEGNCYLFQPSHVPKMSYYDAEDYCRSQGAHLASIHSERENEFILNTMDKGRFGGRKWIGLNILDGEDKPRWSDDSPVNYEKKIPKEFYKNEKCFIMYITQRVFGVVVGGWRPEHCALHYSPICKRAEGIQPTTVPPPTTIAPPTGYCPKDWIQFGQKCYKYFGAAEAEREHYKGARSACWNLGKKYDLVSIHSMEEQAFLTQHLYDLGVSAWIGINYVESDEIGHDMVFGWVDNSRNDFSFWAAGHPPRGTWKYCGRLSYEGVNKGVWVADYCEVSKMGYICQTPSDPKYPVPVPEPSKCKEGFEGYRNSCYRFMTEPQSQEKAEEMCQELGGHVASIVDSFEQAFLYNYLISEEPKEIGIGLENVKETRFFRWVDKQPLYYSNWVEDRPQLRAHGKSCVSMHSSDDFKWNVTDCSRHLPYVCKISTDVPPTYPEILGTCPTENLTWIDIGTEYCYHVAESLSWDGASRYCTTRGMKMISIHSDHEVNSLVAYLWRETRPGHLGLLRSFDKKSFIWVDDTLLNYTNWADREPSSWSSEKNCVAFSQTDGKWTPISCSDWGVTICRTNKVTTKIHSEN